jgi:hypothetical protein
MAYDSRTFRILIASPSDVEEEREIAMRVIQEWNDLNSYSGSLFRRLLLWRPKRMPKLSVNLLSKGKYFRVGEEIPAEELPASVLKYVLGDESPAPPDQRGRQEIHHRTVKLYVRRGNGFVLAEDEELISGEPFYRRRTAGDGFERTGKLVPQ